MLEDNENNELLTFDFDEMIQYIITEIYRSRLK